MIYGNEANKDDSSVIDYNKVTRNTIEIPQSTVAPYYTKIGGDDNMSYLKDQKAKQLSETIDKLKKSHLVDKIYPQNVFGKTKTENFKKSKDSDFRRPNQGNHIPSDPFIEEIDEDYP